MKVLKMTKHIAEGLMSVQVMEGQIKFITDVLQSVELNKGQMLSLHEGIYHSVLATKESVFLLRLIKYTNS